jgi:hypothetical protein
MDKQMLKTETFVGVVEDNKDPRKLGRIKVRVHIVYNDIPTSDLPWAFPHKDLNGNQFILPDVGKIVSVKFDQGNIYEPEYMYADHYNANLEKKLSTLSDSNYTSMRALMFDHKTQIYSNDEEGLKMDYKFNNVNIKNSSIDINLKDNFAKVNIGTSNADQQSILGNNFLNWFDEFVENLMGSNGGPYMGNLGAPVVPNPAMLQVLQKYQELKDPKFLSHHVNVVDNEQVEKLDRVNIGQIGDKWKSTTEQNNTKTEPTNYSPQSGNSTDTPPGELTTFVDENGNVQNPAGDKEPPPIIPTTNPNVSKIIAAMQKKNYHILARPYEMNIVGIRRQYQGQKYSNSFKDDLFLFFKTDVNSDWTSYKFKITTMPGFYSAYVEGSKLKRDKSGRSPNVKQSSVMLSRGGMGILMEAQYLNIYQIGSHCGAPAMKTLGPQKFYRDKSPGDTIQYTTQGQGEVGMLIHRGYPGGVDVNNWSEGCQVFSNESDLMKFFSICEEHRKRYGNRFNYTLILERDL